MTDSEKNVLVNAFYALRSGPDLVNDLAVFHRDFFMSDISTNRDIHFNLMAEPENQIFFAWHRMQLYEMEQALQEIDPKASLPYWDSSVDQSTTSPLWDAAFMGSFDANWSLERNLGAMGNLPTPGQVTALQATPGSTWPPPTSGINGFYVYANDTERGEVHTGAHRWTGGAMPTRSSPRDPVFYLHHCNIDRLWTDWERRQLSGQGAFHIVSDNMLRYDGTYIFNGSPLPQVDPDEIADPRILGVFYAEAQLAELFNYTVSLYGNSSDIRQVFGAHTESFYYQFQIDVGNGFTVPSGARCQIESVNQIQLIPGFEAASGSSFTATIDTDVALLLKTSEPLAVHSNKVPFDLTEIDKDIHAFDPRELLAPTLSIKAFPNPFTERIQVQIDKDVPGIRMALYDLSGKLLLQKSFQNSSELVLDNLNNLPPGFYVVEVSAGEEILLREKFIKE